MITTVAAETGWTYATRSDMFVQTCCNCGLLFAVPNDYDDRRRNDHRTFYCPNGHGQSYRGRSEVEKERDRLKRELGWAQSSAQSWKDQAETAEHRRRAEKGAKTKLQKRIAAGVCPCCRRSFQNLQRHIAGQHPDYPTEV